MKHDLCKFLHWLSSSTFRNRLFDNQIKNKFISILSWFLNQENRNQNSFVKMSFGNRIISLSVSIIMIWSVSFFTFGRLSTDDIHFESKNIDFDTTYVKVTFNKNIRKFIENNCKEKYKVKYFNNLQNLSDEVFFTMISEINEKKIPTSLFFRLIDQESHFLFVRNKRTGANGYTQLLPSTQRMMLKKFGTSGNYLVDNIKFGAEILKMGYDRHKSKGYSDKESWFRSLVDYNGGSKSLAKRNMEYYDDEIDFIKKGD